MIWPDGLDSSCELKDLEDFCVSDTSLRENILSLEVVFCTT